MGEYRTLRHTQWECLYQVVFIPKCRRRTLYVGFWEKCSVAWHSSERAVWGRASDAGRRIHAATGTAEVFSIPGGGVDQREECDPYGSGVRRAGEELRGPRISGHAGILSRRWVETNIRFPLSAAVARSNYGTVCTPATLNSMRRGWKRCAKRNSKGDVCI